MHCLSVRLFRTAPAVAVGGAPSFAMPCDAICEPVSCGKKFYRRTEIVLLLRTPLEWLVGWWRNMHRQLNKLFYYHRSVCCAYLRQFSDKPIFC